MKIIIKKFIQINKKPKSLECLGNSIDILIQCKRIVRATMVAKKLGAR